MKRSVRAYFFGLLPNSILFLKNSAVAKNAISLYIIQISEYIIPLITIPYVVRVIGPAGFGVVSFCQGLIGYFTIFVDYGFSMSATRNISLNRNDRTKVNEIFSTTITSKLLLLFLGFIILGLLSLASAKIGDNFLLMAVAYLGICGNAIIPLWLFQGLENMRFLGVANVISKLFMIFCVFIFVKDKNDILVYLFLLSLTQILYGLISLVYAMKRFNMSFQLVSLVSLRESFKDGWALFLCNASISLYSVGNSFLLGLFISPVYVGYYSGAEKISRAMIGLISPITQSIYPRMVKIASESRNTLFIMVKKILSIMSIFGIFLSVCLFVFAPYIVEIVLGADYSMAIPLIRVMSILPLLVAISNVLGIHTMLSLGKDAEFTRIVVVGGIINLLVIIFLVKSIGAYAGALSLLSAEIYVTFGTIRNYLLLKRKNGSIS